MTQQLRELKKHGVMAHKVFHKVPPHVEYSLTDFCWPLKDILGSIYIQVKKEHKTFLLKGGESIRLCIEAVKTYSCPIRRKTRERKQVQGAICST
ncbi:MAG: winged helix-turn-helix transcriptional regulator [Ectobacillus sp.]